ncbi:MAG: hypothetical protein WC335_07860 [Candidatus Omnitrophota bacterium]|jgi:flagellar basal body-associated protein FliL|nr:hypothetical protein [Candidatus Omnitrophota bacterium]
MAEKNKSSQKGVGSLKLFIIVVVVIFIAWIIGKGVLTLISSAKQM